MASDPVTYNAQVITDFAARLYKQAASITITTAFIGALGGGVVGLFIAAAAQSQQHMSTTAIIGAVLGGLVGYSRGNERAFKLKLEAQVALCQVQIEKNSSTSQS